MCADSSVQSQDSTRNSHLRLNTGRDKSSGGASALPKLPMTPSQYQEEYERLMEATASQDPDMVEFAEPGAAIDPSNRFPHPYELNLSFLDSLDIES